jgi:hypothetical protein
VLAKCSAKETPIIESSSSEMERVRLRRPEELVGEGVGLYLSEFRWTRLFARDDDGELVLELDPLEWER